MIDAIRTRIGWGFIALAILLIQGNLFAADWFVAPGAPTGDGSKAKPFHDPWRALAIAIPGDRIHIAEGVYIGRYDRSAWDLDRPRITILGGYDRTFSVRDPWKHPSVLSFYPDYEGSYESNLLTGRDDHSGVEIDGLVFDGGGRNTYDPKPPMALKSGLNQVGALLSVSSPEVTVRNCVFINSTTGAVESRGDAFRFENNLVLNHKGPAILSLRDSPGASKKPALIKGNTFAFAYDDSDPPMGRGGEKGTAIRIAGQAVVDGNVFIASGNSAILLFTQPERVSIDRNVFWLSMRANVAVRDAGKESLIADKNLEELEDLGLKSCAANSAADVGLTGLKPDWVDGVTHHLLTSYAKPPKENLAKVRGSFKLPESPTAKGKEDEFGVAAPYLDVASACAVRVTSPAGAKPVELKVALASDAAAPVAATYDRIHWAELATGNVDLNGRRVEVRVALGNERNGFVLKGMTAEKYFGFDVMHPGGEGYGDQLHVYTVRFSPAQRQFEQSNKSNNAREAEDWYLLRGIYRAADGRQKGTLEVEQVVPTDPVPRAKVTRPQGRDWFVRAGSTGGDGSKDKPFRDPFQALEKAEGGDNIHIAGGDYFGKLRSANWKVSIRNLAMFGGYDAQFATRDPWKNATRLIMTPEAAAADKSKHGATFLETTEVCDNFILDGLVFDAASVNAYNEPAAGGGLNLKGSPLGTMVRVLGPGITIRNCVFANSWGAAVDISGQFGVFENNVVANCSGTGVNIVAEGMGPWLIRGNTFLFASDPTARAATGKSSLGTLLTLRGRANARIERNVFGFADNFAIRATMARQKLMLDNNAFIGNPHCHYTDANYVWLYDAVWDRRVADSGLGSALGNTIGWPGGVTLNRDYANKALPRLFELKGRYDSDAWSKIAKSVGATVAPPSGAAAGPSTQPKPTEKPKEPSLDDLMAELSKVKVDAKPVESAKGPAYCPAFAPDQVMELVAAGDPATAIGARRTPIQVAFSGTGAGPSDKTYEKVTFAQIGTGRDALAGKPIELEARRPRSSGSGGTEPPDLSADNWTGYQVLTLDDSVPKLPVVVFVRRDSAASKLMDRAVLTDTLRFRGVARVVPNYRGLVVAVDSVSVVEGK